MKPGGVNRTAFESAVGVKLPDTSSGTRAFLKTDSGENNLYYIGKNKGNGFPPTQVNTEVSQSAVSETVLYNSIISNAQQKATPASKEVSDNILNQLYNQPGDLGAKASPFKYKEADSKFRTNTMENTDMWFLNFVAPNHVS